MIKVKKLVGSINKAVIDALGLVILEGEPIFLGESNLTHMKTEHPDNFNKYGNRLEEILSNPDFVTLHPHNESIEYIKIIEPDYVLVAVRVSLSGVAYVRTLFVMSDEKVEKYKKHGYMHLLS